MSVSSSGAQRALTTRLRASAGFLLFVAGLNIVTTQWIAHNLGFRGFFRPWAWIEWLQWYQRAPDAFARPMVALLACMVVGLAVAVIYTGVRTRSATAHVALHGTAHFADRDEVIEAGLFPQNREGDSVYLGGWRDPESGEIRYLRHSGPEHVATIAPSRSGKGITSVVPTLLSWRHSVMVNDLKGELWNLTAGWRSSEDGANNDVIKFDPAAETNTAQFNPCAEVRIGEPAEVGDAQNLVTMIVDPDGKGLQDHWQKTAYMFLTGLLLFVLYRARANGRVGCMGDVADAISDPSRDINELYGAMLTNRFDADNLYEAGGVHPVIASAARDQLNRPDEERGSVLSTAMSYLGLYRDPIVRRNTSRSDFRIMDMMNRERPVSLFLVVRPEDKDRMRPLMRVILNQFMRVLLRPELQFRDGRPLPPHKHRLLMLLDEFPSYGKLEVFEEALGYIAGYMIKAYLIAQDMAQLWKSYGRDEAITSNCTVRTVYAPNRLDTAEWISKNTGTTTEVKWQITESGRRFGGFADNYSRTSQETARPLMTADEVMRLPAARKDASEQIVEPGEMLAFVAGHAPIRGVQTPYFLDPEFRRRSAIAPPERALPVAHAVQADPDAGFVERARAVLWGG